MATSLYRRAAAGLVLASLVAIAGAQVSYRVEPDLAKGTLAVEMRLRVTAQESRVRMPSWAPGAYMLRDGYKNVSEFKATGVNAAPLPFTVAEDGAWVVRTAGTTEINVSYRVPAQTVPGVIHYSGPSTYLFVEGHTTEPCTLTFAKIPAAWKVMTGLDAKPATPNTFTAPNYDVLADNPVTMGTNPVYAYLIDGKPHYLALRGPGMSDVDVPKLISACSAISAMQEDFFGGLPYKKFVWHLNISDGLDGGGGLEHLNSTQISIASGVGPRGVSVLSHEFLHLWNVKRIRSAPLGPFDYTVLPKTGALWWLEGVTDYYAHLLLFRYAMWDEAMFHNDILSNMRTVRSKPARLEVSPNDASLRVGEASGGRGNSQGFGVSYYDTGWLVGMCLDTEIRSRTGGEHSLDDVMLALWQMCRDDKPGFAEDAIRALCVRFGGPELGPFYDKLVMQPGELPVEAQLEKMGLRVAERMESSVDVGFEWTADKAEKGARVRNVHGAATDRLVNGDLIVEIAGKKAALDTVRAISEVVANALKAATTRDTLLLHVLREGKEVEVRILPTSEPKTVQRIEGSAPGDAARSALRKGWYYAGKRKS